MIALKGSLIMQRKSFGESTLDELLQEDSMLEEVEAIAKRRVILWQKNRRDSGCEGS